MSCSTMSISYQPYAISFTSCNRTTTNDKQKHFKYPLASSPDSLHSEASSSYNSPGPSSLTIATGSSASSSSVSATITGNSNSQNPSSLRKYSDGSLNNPRPHRPSSSHSQIHSQNHSHNSSSTITSASNASARGNSSSSSKMTNSSSTATSSSGCNQNESLGESRSQYLSANCMILINYQGEVSRVVDEHFSRALSAAYSNDKTSKTVPMSSRPFPPSFWNSNYQAPKPLAAFHSAPEFYGGVEYGGGIPGLTHHQADPWHYPLSTHQNYHHHRHSEIPYPTTSRFNAAQYGSFLLGAASGGAGRFPVSQCGTKGETSEWWRNTDLHLADYSAAAAAAAHSHYSNMGLEASGSGPDSSKDLYWF